jgi:hypothetical protein
MKPWAFDGLFTLTAELYQASYIGSTIGLAQLTGGSRHCSALEGEELMASEVHSSSNLAVFLGLLIVSVCTRAVLS